MIKGHVRESKAFNRDIDVNYILKLAKQSYENYLLRSDSIDLENAIDYYVRAIKLNPAISESYYKLANLMWEKGQIDIDTAVEQCRQAIKIEPKSREARLYLGYFLKTAEMYDEAENEFQKAIELNRLFSAKPRLALSLTLFQKMNTGQYSFNDFVKALQLFFGNGYGFVGLFRNKNALQNNA
jgi:tetratricopeptide (TPR) repeat protein